MDNEKEEKKTKQNQNEAPEREASVRGQKLS